MDAYHRITITLEQHDNEIVMQLETDPRSAVTPMMAAASRVMTRLAAELAALATDDSPPCHRH